MVEETLCNNKELCEAVIYILNIPAFVKDNKIVTLDKNVYPKDVLLQIITFLLECEATKITCEQIIAVKEIMREIIVDYMSKEIRYFVTTETLQIVTPYIPAFAKFLHIEPGSNRKDLYIMCYDYFITKNNYDEPTLRNFFRIIENTENRISKGYH